MNDKLKNTLLFLCKCNIAHNKENHKHQKGKQFYENDLIKDRIKFSYHFCAFSRSISIRDKQSVWFLCAKCITVNCTEKPLLITHFKGLSINRALKDEFAWRSACNVSGNRKGFCLPICYNIIEIIMMKDYFVNI